MTPTRLSPCSVSCPILERFGPEPFRNGSVGLMAGFPASVHLLSFIATSCAKEWRKSVELIVSIKGRDCMFIWVWVVFSRPKRARETLLTHPLARRFLKRNKGSAISDFC